MSPRLGRCPGLPHYSSPRYDPEWQNWHLLVGSAGCRQGDKIKATLENHGRHVPCNHHSQRVNPSPINHHGAQNRPSQPSSRIHSIPILPGARSTAGTTRPNHRIHDRRQQYPQFWCCSVECVNYSIERPCLLRVDTRLAVAWPATNTCLSFLLFFCASQADTDS